MQFTTPFQLYAWPDAQKTLSAIQLQWQQGRAAPPKTGTFWTLEAGIVRGMPVLHHWLQTPAAFDAPALSRLLNVRDERGTNIFSESFVNFLQRFRFPKAVWTVAEGTDLRAEQPLVQAQGTALELAILQFWVKYVINPPTYLAEASQLLQIRRFYEQNGAMLHDIIFSPDTPPIVNFEAASWEDLLQSVQS